jgi:hypothetical protein
MKCGDWVIAPQHPTCKLGRDLYDECFNCEGKQQVKTKNLQSLPVSSEVFISERVLSGVSFLTIFHG